VLLTIILRKRCAKLDEAWLLLTGYGLGADLWAALVTANYTRNRLPSSVHGITPWEMFFGEKPGVSHMRVFGAPAYLHIPKVRRQKMEPVSERAMFMGYAADSKAYRVQRVRDGRVMIARDVIVNETQSQTSVTVELSSGEEKGSRGARGLGRVSPPTQMGAGDTSAEESGTQPGAGDTSAEAYRVHRERGTGSEGQRSTAVLGQPPAVGQLPALGGQPLVTAEGTGQPALPPLKRGAIRFATAFRRLASGPTAQRGVPLQRVRLTRHQSPKRFRKP
jgi:hypothetical protein